MIEYYYQYKLTSINNNYTGVLIGSNNILSTKWWYSPIKYNSEYRSYTLKLNDFYCLACLPGYMGLNPSHPTITLNVSGFSYRCYKNDSVEYHLNVSYSTDKHQFIQSLDNEINSVKGFKNIISYLHLEFMGDIDNDGINDFILTDASNFRNYLFLSYRHDVIEKKMMHLEKGFINDKYDFLKDF